jgi:hypothetical protein
MPPFPVAWLHALAVVAALATGAPGVVDPVPAGISAEAAAPASDTAAKVAVGRRTPVGSFQAELTVRFDSAAGYRPVLTVGPVLDTESLREAIASGIPIRVHIRVELWRDGFFDALEGSEAWSTVLLYEPLSERFVVRAPDTRGTALQYETYEDARQAIEGERMPLLRPRRTGNHYYTATLVLETLSLSDIEELQRWLRGELQPAVSGDRSIPGALSGGARRLVVRLLRLPTRRIEARSPRFRVSSLPGDSP